VIEKFADHFWKTQIELDLKTEKDQKETFSENFSVEFRSRLKQTRNLKMKQFVLVIALVGAGKH
jgi:hypothetical protein